MFFYANFITSVVKFVHTECRYNGNEEPAQIPAILDCYFSPKFWRSKNFLASTSSPQEKIKK